MICRNKKKKFSLERSPEIKLLEVLEENDSSSYEKY